MTLKRLSKASEERILKGLDKVANLINESDISPNDAIVKAASELKIPIEHIDQMVFAYNNARSNIQRKQASSTFDKAAEFPLADSKVIKKVMYPTEYKSKAAEYNETAVSDEYNISPVWAIRISHKPLITIKEVVKQAAATPTKQANFDSILNEINFRKRQLYEFRMHKSALADNICKDEEKLEIFFKTASKPFNQIKELALMAYGDGANAVLDNVAEVCKKYIKTASANARWMAYDPVQEPFKTIGNLINNKRILSAYTEKYAQLEKAVADLEVRLTRPFYQKAATITSVIDGIPFSPTKEAFSIGGLFGGVKDVLSGTDIAKGIAKEIPGTKPTEALLRSDLSRLSDPYHEASLREIQVESMLNDLMANDEVIGGHKPEDVIRIYNEINQIAPHASNQKMLVRALLRKRLQYGGDQVDPVDINQLLEIENRLKDRRELIGSPGAMGYGLLGDGGTQRR